MRLNEVVKKVDLSRRAVKYYEEKGLLRVKKDSNGYRNYTLEDVKILEKISLYRKLGIGIREIKRLLEDGDDGLLDQISSEKEQEIRKLTIQWEELKKYIQTKETEGVCSVIDYETVGEKLKDMFPGFYGYYFLHHFLPYLQIRMETEEQKEAYERIVDFLDNTDIKIPFFMKVSAYIMYRFLPEPSMDTMIKKMDDQIKGYLNPTEKEYEKLKKQTKQNVKMKNSFFFKYHPAFVSQRHFMKRLQDCGYNDIFIPAMMELSPKYKEYREALMQINDRICKDLNLYYDSDFRLRMKKEN